MNPERDFFRSSVCGSCKKVMDQQSKKCAQCKTVYYCSKEHQIQDWKRHKAICKVIASEGQHLDYNVQNFEDLQNYKQQRRLLWQLKLGRKLTRAECQMFMFPQACAICYKREQVFACSKCLCEFYCSVEHQQQHTRRHQIHCLDMRLALDMDCHFYHNEPVNMFTVKKVCHKLDSIPDNLDILSHVVEASDTVQYMHYFESCDLLLSGITLLFALERVGAVQKRKLVGKQSLQIHLVGSTAFEFSLNWALIIEVFFHWIVNLESFNVTFIGPEVPEVQLDFGNLTAEFCQRCTGRKNLTVGPVKVYKNMYHEIVNDLDSPDMVVAFNSGLHEFSQSTSDTWKASLSSLLRPEIPLVLTAYTYKEIEEDLQILQQIADFKRIYGPTRNPFSNMRPFHDWATEFEPIYFINGFLCVVQVECKNHQ